ncbi:Molybdopterin synthase catalytic subunit 1 [Phycisphaerae bacterium RAS1]|nr:Molybdopterin synthase catalytic subunit 1 [Phycisphaerae bacterium RAS1]
MSESVEVRVLLFGAAADVVGWSEKTWPLPSGALLADLIAALESAHPRLAEARGKLVFAVNERYAGPATPLAPGDEIAVIPPVSGGQTAPPVLPPARLTRARIDVERLAREIAATQVGAVATFVGLVREEQDASGRALIALEYSAYEPMALVEMGAIVEAVTSARPLHAVRLVHRLGRLAIGEASVAALVSSPHRADAFDACRELIERLKQSVPIFKKEIWADGGATWVNAI